MDEIQLQDRRFKDDHENMLREFIRADCASGGEFVIDVITSGGKMERAALIMVADLQNYFQVFHYTDEHREKYTNWGLLCLVNAAPACIVPAIIGLNPVPVHEWRNAGIRRIVTRGTNAPAVTTAPAKRRR